MSSEALHIFFPPAVGVGLTIASFLIDDFVSGRLHKYLVERHLPDALAERIVRVSASIALLVTYYANVIVLLTNLLLAFAVFPLTYGYWVILIDFVVLLLIEAEIGWLWEYDAIDITDELPALELPRLGVISVELWLRLVQIAFNVFTVVYFYVGYRLSESG